MEDGALRLESRSEDIQRVDNGCAQTSTQGTDSAGGKVVQGNVVLVAVVEASFARNQGALEVFEGRQVDGRVWEHARDPERQAAEETEETVLIQHLSKGGGDQLVALWATYNSFTLHATGSW